MPHSAVCTDDGPCGHLAGSDLGADMSKQRNLVVIAASRGGFEVLKTLVSGLPDDLAAAVCIVLHIGRHQSTLPDLMSHWGPLPAIYPKDDETLRQGHIYVAPPDRHLVVEGRQLHLSDLAPENYCRPAADPLFRSAATERGRGVVGVVLSGDLDDGAAGFAMIQACGGYCLVQTPADCEAPSMPNAAMRAVGGTAATARIPDLADAIASAVGGAPAMGDRVADDGWQVEEEARIASRGAAAPQELDGIGRRCEMKCPQCGGYLWEIHGGLPLRYRCDAGHAFSEQSIGGNVAREIERAIRNARRGTSRRRGGRH
jgi:two-component system, chemotaxis family, protein-glutamate methylesterase/glutaminase